MKTEVLIAGGGIPGLALALALGRGGMSVVLVDSLAFDLPPQGSGAPTRTSALMDGSASFLDTMGTWDAVRPLAGVLKTLRLVDDGLSPPVQVDFHAADIGLDAFAFNTPNDALRRALAAILQNECPSVRLVAPANLLSFTLDERGIKARIDTGADISAALIVGADGRHSAVRECAGIAITHRDYNQQAITCLVDHSRDHDNTSTEFHRSGGPFTTVPLPGRRSSIVWMTRSNQADTLMRLDKRSFTASLQTATNGILGKVDLATPPQSWPIITLSSKTLVAPRCALMAEAAHVLSPIGAQGMNLSLRDAKVLAEVLLDSARIGLDIGSASVLRRYETLRKLDITARVFGVDAFNKMVLAHSPLATGLRRLGLRGLQGSALLRDALMRSTRV